MSKEFKTLGSLIETSNLRSLLQEAQQHHSTLEIIQQALCESSPIISKADVLSCEISNTKVILGCKDASKATLVQQTAFII